MAQLISSSPSKVRGMTAKRHSFRVTLPPRVQGHTWSSKQKTTL